MHDPKEPYVGSMCESITHELYVPASSALDPTLAPFLPPYVLQAQIEGTIAKYESINPNFWTSDCRLARREYLCGAFFRYNCYFEFAVCRPFHCFLFDYGNLT